MLPFFWDLCPHEDEQQLGTQIRDEAEKLLEAEWGKSVHSWADCHLLITEHTEHSAMEEGEEALPVVVGDPHDDDDDEDQNEDDVDNGDDDMDGADNEENGDQGDIEEDEDGDADYDDVDDEDHDNDDNRGDDMGYSPTSVVPEECEGGELADTDKPPRSGPTPAPASSSAGTAPILNRNITRLQMLDNAVAVGGDAMVRYIRCQLSNDRRRDKGKSIALYDSMASKLAVEKQVRGASKRAFAEEAQNRDIMLVKVRRCLLAEDLEATQIKRKKLEEDAAAIKDRRVRAKELEDEKKKSIWYETVFPAKHAALMMEFIKHLSPAALSQHREKCSSCKRWVRSKDG